MLFKHDQQAMTFINALLTKVHWTTLDNHENIIFILDVNVLRVRGSRPAGLTRDHHQV